MNWLRAISLLELKRQYYFWFVSNPIMKNQKEMRSLKIELMKSLTGSNNGYFGLSLETLVDNW